MLINLSNLVLCFYFCVVICRAYQRYDSTVYNYPRQVTTTSRYNLGSDVKLRHSKFENLARVNSKIDSMNSFKSSSSSRHKLRHNKWHDFTTTTTTESSMFEDYGDLEYNEDYSNDFQGTEDDDDMDLEYDEDLDSDSKLSEDVSYDENGWQAEEPTEKPTYRPLSSFAEYKYNILGTRERVAETRRQFTNHKPTDEEINVRLAIEHYHRVKQEGLCDKPKPQVVYVQSEHPNYSKKYVPHCTVLHRCSQETGCCNHGSYRCQYKTRQLIDLYFYERSVGDSSSKVVKLSFYNHTACGCKDINRNQTEVVTVKPSHAGVAFKSASNAIFPLVPESFRGCKCPEVYKAKPSHATKCYCDCDAFNETCSLFKRGIEHFGYRDRKCISEKVCGIPKCEYGIYNHVRGKCPTRQEKLDMFRGLPRL